VQELLCPVREVGVRGHTRFALCTELGIPFETAALHLPDRQACLDWMSRHQRDRRNLGKNGASYSRGKHYLAEKLACGRPGMKTGQNRRLANGTKGGQTDHLSGNERAGRNDHRSPAVHALRTARRLAKFYGVGERTIRRDARFAAAVDALAAHCGEIARQFVLPAGSPLHRTDVGRILQLEPNEQCRLLALVRAHARSALPWFRHQNAGFSVPRNPARIPQIILDRLGKGDAVVVRDGLTGLLGEEQSNHTKPKGE
jgi:hypothetical protein